jgi:hypothetical protein
MWNRTVLDPTLLLKQCSAGRFYTDNGSTRSSEALVSTYYSAQCHRPHLCCSIVSRANKPVSLCLYHSAVRRANKAVSLFLCYSAVRRDNKPVSLCLYYSAVRGENKPVSLCLNHSAVRRENKRKSRRIRHNETNLFHCVLFFVIFV